MNLLDLLPDTRIGSGDEPVDLHLDLGARLAVAVEQSAGQLSTTPAHRTRCDLQRGDVTMRIQFDEDALGLTTTPDCSCSLGQLLTVSTDLLEALLQLLFPRLKVSHVTPANPRHIAPS
ncbi:hypothetical protein [Nocardia sp. 852002-51244_SCH5132740]|uniref:hypothetical protein n=1 Tax=Nocardia sp. 852002-51244_SCH5132740 TaxID=1834099 RepID=UPI0007EA6FAA|nr:hypothetical protein A5748_10995 [Nocardia sp. 852002-51244_SCH5132740]